MAVGVNVYDGRRLGLILDDVGAVDDPFLVHEPFAFLTILHLHVIRGFGREGRHDPVFVGLGGNSIDIKNGPNKIGQKYKNRQMP